MVRLTYEDRATIRRVANKDERMAPGVTLRMLHDLDTLDPPPEPKTEDDPRFHFCRVTNDLADLQGTMCEAMAGLTRLAESTGQTTRAFFASKDK